MGLEGYLELMPKLGQSIGVHQAGLPGLEIRAGLQKLLLEGPRQAFAGQVTVSAASTPTRLPAKPVRVITIRPNDIADIYIGDAGVSDTAGFLLDRELTMYIGRMDSIYIWSSDANAKVYWIGS